MPMFMITLVKSEKNKTDFRQAHSAENNTTVAITAYLACRLEHSNSIDLA